MSDKQCVQEAGDDSDQSLPPAYLDVGLVTPEYVYCFRKFCECENVFSRAVIIKSAEPLSPNEIGVRLTALEDGEAEDYVLIVAPKNVSIGLDAWSPVVDYLAPVDSFERPGLYHLDWDLLSSCWRFKKLPQSVVDHVVGPAGIEPASAP